jgi:hypothetical protein
MIKIGGNENDTFQLWKKWHDSHSIDSDPKLCSSIVPKNNKIRSYEDRYSIKFKSNILAIFSFDINQMENRNENIVDIDDILLNPDIDFSISIKAIADYFQKEGWCAAKFGCNLIYHHPYITDIFKDQGKLNTCDYVMCLRSYSTKGDKKLSIKCLENKHETNCSIYKFVEEEQFLKDYDRRVKNNIPSDFITCEAEYLSILLDKPFFYIHNNEDDIVFELIINDIKYKYCDCSTEHPNRKNCPIGSDYRRLNKIWQKIEITGYDHEKKYRFSLLFGMIVPKDTGVLVDRKVMISRNKSHHKNITPVSYHFSEYIKQFPIKKLKRLIVMPVKLFEAFLFLIILFIYINRK